MTFCAEPGCGVIVDGGRCLAHRASRQDAYDRYRGSRQARGYDDRWARRAAQYRQAHPLCAACQERGRVTLGTCVDHVVPHKGDRRLFDDPANWQTLCAACHMRKTAAGL